MESSFSFVGGENDVSFAITEKAFLKLCVELVVLITNFEKCPLFWGLKIYHLVSFNISFEPSAVKPNLSQILVKSVIVNIQYAMHMYVAPLEASVGMIYTMAHHLEFLVVFFDINSSNRVQYRDWLEWKSSKLLQLWVKSAEQIHGTILRVFLDKSFCRLGSRESLITAREGKQLIRMVIDNRFIPAAHLCVEMICQFLRRLSVRSMVNRLLAAGYQSRHLARCPRLTLDHRWCSHVWGQTQKVRLQALDALVFSV